MRGIRVALGGAIIERLKTWRRNAKGAAGIMATTTKTTKQAASKNSRRSTPHSVSARWSALYTTRISEGEVSNRGIAISGEEPGEELQRKESQAAAEDHAGDLPLGPTLAVH